MSDTSADSNNAYSIPPLQVDRLLYFLIAYNKGSDAKEHNELAHKYYFYANNHIILICPPLGL